MVGRVLMAVFLLMAAAPFAFAGGCCVVVMADATTGPGPHDMIPGVMVVSVGAFALAICGLLVCMAFRVIRR